MPTKVLNEDWSMYDNRKIRHRRTHGLLLFGIPRLIFLTQER
jgi:hypothetical protein